MTVFDLQPSQELERGQERVRASKTVIGIEVAFRELLVTHKTITQQLYTKRRSESDKLKMKMFLKLETGEHKLCMLPHTLHFTCYNTLYT